MIDRIRVYGSGWLLALMLSVSTGCGEPGAPAEGPDDPFLRGPVESIIHRATSSGILVQPEPGSEAACGIAATVDAETEYFRRTDDGELRLSGLAELEIGNVVEVHVRGPIAESCPVRGNAATIILLERPFE